MFRVIPVVSIIFFTGIASGQEWVECGDCYGSGTTETELVCEVCGGAGYFYAECSSCGGSGTYEADCPWCAGGYITCGWCSGDGVWDEEKCPPCNGLGLLRCEVCNGRSVVYESCTSCSGYGYILQECSCCDGSGTTVLMEACSSCNGQGGWWEDEEY